MNELLMGYVVFTDFDEICQNTRQILIDRGSEAFAKKRTFSL